MVGDLAGIDWPLEPILAGETLVRVPLAGLVDAPPMGDWAVPPTEAIIVAVTKPGHAAPSGVLILARNPLRPHDPEMAEIVAGPMDELEAFFTRCVTAGQREGTINPDRNAADMGRLFLTTVFGLRVLARGRPERALLEGSVRQVLALLDPSPTNQ